MLSLTLSAFQLDNIINHLRVYAYIADITIIFVIIIIAEICVSPQFDRVGRMPFFYLFNKLFVDIFFVGNFLKWFICTICKGGDRRPTEELLCAQQITTQLITSESFGCGIPCSCHRASTGEWVSGINHWKLFVMVANEKKIQIWCSCRLQNEYTHTNHLKRVTYLFSCFFSAFAHFWLAHSSWWQIYRNSMCMWNIIRAEGKTRKQENER